jgi:hypothetical protein
MSIHQLEMLKARRGHDGRSHKGRRAGRLRQHRSSQLEPGLDIEAALVELVADHPLFGGRKLTVTDQLLDKVAVACLSRDTAR